MKLEDEDLVASAVRHEAVVNLALHSNLDSMSPSTPQRSHSRKFSIASTPGTPDTGYVLAQESLEDSPTPAGSHASRPDLDETSSLPEIDNDATSFQLQHNLLQSNPSPRRQDTSASNSSSASGSGSYSTDPELLEMLENDDTETDFDITEEELEDGLLSDVGDPLVSRGRRRRRKRWIEDEEVKEKSLFELVPPLILAHPLPLLPMLALLPYNFLPAGVVFFIPILCVLTILSSCAHIVIVYLAWYLKVASFEDVFASVTGKYGRYGQWAGRAAVIVSTVGLLVGWLETMAPLLDPVVKIYLPASGFFQSSILWTIFPAMSMLPTLLPPRMTRSLRRVPMVLALLLPVVAFLVIGRTSEISKAAADAADGSVPTIPEEVAAATNMIKRTFGLAGGSSAGAGIATLTIFLSPHLNTLPIHAGLPQSKRAQFPLPCLISSAIMLALSLPFALVPYYLIAPLLDTTPTATPTISSGVFGQLPVDDGWVNVARIFQCILGLGTSNMWMLRGRDSILGGLGVQRGDRLRVGRWVGLAIWVLVVSLACLGGWVAEKVETLGVIATLAVAWLLPSMFFIITFHVRSPLSIVFPSRNPPPEPAANQPSRSSSRSHSRHDSLSDPSADVLLARKERQLQKRRLGRRLWQDLIVYVGILPVGCVTTVWSIGNLLGFW